MAVSVLSRLPGLYWGVSALAWSRDFQPLLNLSWIVVGPFAFPTEKNIRRGYLTFVMLVAALTVIVTAHFMVLRRFSAVGTGLTPYVSATDSVVLFGVFMTAPMAALPGARRRVWFSLLTAIFVTATFLTGTRSHLAALLAGFAFYLWLVRGKREGKAQTGRIVALGSVLLGVIAFALILASGTVNTPDVAARADQMETMSFGGITYRLDETLLAWKAFEKSPFFGHGLGYLLPTVRYLGSQANLYMIHNFYFYLLVKFGVIGAAIFLCFIASMLKSSISTYRQSKEPFQRAFAAGLASLVVGLVVESLTLPRFTDKSATALLSLLFCLLLSIRREIAEGRELRAPEPGASAYGKCFQTALGSAAGVIYGARPSGRHLDRAGIDRPSD